MVVTRGRGGCGGGGGWGCWGGGLVWVVLGGGGGVGVGVVGVGGGVLEGGPWRDREKIKQFGNHRGGEELSGGKGAAYRLDRGNWSVYERECRKRE